MSSPKVGRKSLDSPAQLAQLKKLQQQEAAACKPSVEVKFNSGQSAGWGKTEACWVSRDEVARFKEKLPSTVADRAWTAENRVDNRPSAVLIDPE